MEKTKAIAYREFVVEAEKAFDLVYCQDSDLTAFELDRLKNRFSKKQFESIYNDFEKELQDNIIKYDKTAYIKAYLQTVFKDVCVVIDNSLFIAEVIIYQDFETEFLLNLCECLNKSKLDFNYFCEKSEFSTRTIRLESYFSELKSSKNEEVPEQNNNIHHQYNPRYDFDRLKTELDNTPLTPTEKYNLVNDRLFDFLQWQKQHDIYNDWASLSSGSKYKITNKLYPNFEKLCRLEIDRWKAILSIKNIDAKKEETSDISATATIPKSYKISSKRKTDVIKILSAMYDCKLFVDKDNKPITSKQELMDAFGEFFNEDFKAYSTLLTQAKDKDPSTFYKPFDQLRNASKEYYEG